MKFNKNPQNLCIEYIKNNVITNNDIKEMIYKSIKFAYIEKIKPSCSIPIYEMIIDEIIKSYVVKNIFNKVKANIYYEIERYLYGKPLSYNYKHHRKIFYLSEVNKQDLNKIVDDVLDYSIKDAVDDFIETLEIDKSPKEINYNISSKEYKKCLNKNIKNSSKNKLNEKEMVKRMIDFNKHKEILFNKFNNLGEKDKYINWESQLHKMDYEPEEEINEEENNDNSSYEAVINRVIDMIENIVAMGMGTMNNEEK